MGKLVISTNASLDGVVQDPDGQEGSRLGGWFATSAGKDLEVWRKGMFEETLSIQALLLGRRTEEWFGTRWTERTDDWANALNALPKYVISGTLDEPRWTNTTILRGDAVKEAATLKQEIDGTIVVYASYQLSSALLDAGLVDEVRLYVFPVVLGEGERFLGAAGTQTSLRLMETRAVGDSLVYLRYAVTGRD
jgi:dihydrofolate reductase